MEKPRVGISACLLGREVRYDGAHKRDGPLLSSLGPFVEWVPVCPEQELGMGVPREPIRLELVAGATRVVGVSSREDWTARMEAFAGARAAALAGISGFVLKSGSPSCGLTGVKRFHGGLEPPVLDGTGLFAAALLAAWPLLPLQDELRLATGAAREQFLERVRLFSREHRRA